MKISKKQFAVYIIVAFVLAWISQVVACSFYNNGNQVVYSALLGLTMFMPTLATLVAKIPLKGMGWVPHLKGKIRYVFFALWVPVSCSQKTHRRISIGSLAIALPCP